MWEFVVSNPPRSASQCGVRPSHPRNARMGPKSGPFFAFGFVSRLPLRPTWGGNRRKSPALSANIPVLRRLSPETGSIKTAARRRLRSVAQGRIIEGRKVSSQPIFGWPRMPSCKSVWQNPPQKSPQRDHVELFDGCRVVEIWSHRVCRGRGLARRLQAQSVRPPVFIVRNGLPSVACDAAPIAHRTAIEAALACRVCSS
jgi:hypothetical protein